MKKGVSGLTVIRNAFKLGYPFYYSVKSVIDACDEFVISEGFSEDSTMDIVQKLRTEFPSKVSVIRDRWGPSKRGETIAKVTNNAMGKCNYSWIYYVQADEIIHERNLSFIKNVPRHFGRHDTISSVSNSIKRRFGCYNSVSFRFIHFRPTLTSQMSGVYSQAIRMVRNYSSPWRDALDPKTHEKVPGRLLKQFLRFNPLKGFRTIYSDGDGTSFGGNVYPVFTADFLEPVFHVGYVNRDRSVVARRLQSHWESLYPTIPAYREAAEKIRTGEDMPAWSEWSNQRVKIVPYTTTDYPKMLLEWANSEGLEYVK